MRLLVNTLSVGHLSGRHVVYGFLGQLAGWTADQHELLLLHYESSPPPAAIAGDHIRRLAIGERLRGWASRSVWESAVLPRIVRRECVDLVFTASGAISPRCPVPQVSLAQNPWCFVPAAQAGGMSRLKAALQRRGYRHALRNAACMFFISRHLRDLYRRDANGGGETRTEIALVGLNDPTHTEAARQTVEKEPLRIVSVSAMARWKGAETLVAAVAELHRRDVAATVYLVGPWPDAEYERQVRRQIADLGLEQHVAITGKVSKDELHAQYARARVFCLMSCCESFGIPAAEAMAFGTPVVSTEACAISEICAGAGRFGPVGDVAWTADALESVLTDEAAWATYSQQAIRNAACLRWSDCARPLMKMFSL
jgi:glycosyltransferase involved in cell wall biosynthesis